MHPLLHLIATRPQLLAEHAQAYGELMAEEFPRARSAWKQQALLHGLALVGLLAAMLLGGVAWMLWAALPSATMPQPWLLMVVPLLAAAGGAACLLAARLTGGADVMGNLRQQLRADLAMLQASGTAP